MNRTRAIHLAVFVLFVPFVVPSVAAEIDACKYIVVTEQARDRYGIAEEVRRQAAAAGFIVVTNTRAVPDADTFKACVMTADWFGDTTSGEVVLQVMDAVTGTPVALARAGGLNWFGIPTTVRKHLERSFEQLGYTGFDEQVYRDRMNRLYPPRPRIAVTEAEVQRRAPRYGVPGIEGIWGDAEQQYRLGIVALAEPGGADYAAVVLEATAPLWEAGEIKAEFTRTDDPTRFASTYYLLNKQPVAVTFVLDPADRLTAALTVAGATTEIALVRVTP
ncbi:MAG: hypothetical protein AB7P99_13225 [Vicinamibacterales bacterium]